MDNWITHYQQLPHADQRTQFLSTLVHHYTEVFDATLSGFLLLDRQLNILSHNKLAETLFGFAPQPGQPMPQPGDLFEPDESDAGVQHECILQQALQEDRPLSHVQTLRRNGERHWLRLTAIPVTLMAESQVLVVVQDISAEQRLQQNVRNHQQALEQARTRDGLTGLFNRRYILDELGQLNALAKRYRSRFCIALIDLDHFKSVNDTYGHSLADSVLSTLSDLIQEELRDADISARYGEEEFMVLMPETGIDAGISTLDRLRQRFSETRVPGIKRTLTLSAGVIEWQPGLSLEQLVFKTDQRLAMAKYAGRNQVCGDL
ncbi:GGDEF domain-containing protein [Saccharospirillum sp.]|uniref:GGDEF domain-containing protein n=1 Tax=Saccharospirillum sp. TaxID=2033801 RepID=UPI0034A011C1